jgi:hypothetical protein
MAKFFFSVKSPPAVVLCGASPDRHPCAGDFNSGQAPGKSNLATMAFPHAKVALGRPASRTPSTESGIKPVDPLNPSYPPNGDL